MDRDIATRILHCADYMIEQNATVRQAALRFGIGKSVVHYDMTRRLALLDKDRYRAVAQILRRHLETRHLKGGEMTKLKYRQAQTKKPPTPNG